jgi:curli biogenesis system outer membrane secretion channel CsgG
VAQPADQPTGLLSLAVVDVRIGKMLTDSVKDAGKIASLGRVAQAMDGQLIVGFNSTRKCTIIARTDLDRVLKEQDLGNSGNCNPSDPKVAKACQLAGAEYLLALDISDFQDSVQTIEVANVRRTTRVIRCTAVCKIINTTTGKVKEAVSVPAEAEDTTDVRTNVAGTTDGDLSDRLLGQISHGLAATMANRVVDVFYPARIVSVTDKQVTINRGDGTGIAEGQIWIVHSLGKEMFDPDTKESLGREEIIVGKVRVSSVTPKFAKAEILEGAAGMETGALLRLEAKSVPVPVK